MDYEGNSTLYHLNCGVCGRTFWSHNAFDMVCSECKADKSETDIVKVIRCKNCTFYQKPEYGFTKGDCTYGSVWYQTEEDGFCSKAKVKD